MTAKELAQWIEDCQSGMPSFHELKNDEWTTILRALRLLAAAEANDGTTPETDKLDAELAEAIKNGDSSALSVGKAVLAMVVFARRLERERTGLAARVGELENLLPDDYAKADMEARGIKP